MDAEVFNVSVIRRLCQVDEKAQEPPQGAALRRLTFQAHVTVVGDMRQRKERTEDDAPRKISQPERESRKELLEAQPKASLVMA